MIRPNALERTEDKGKTKEWTAREETLHENMEALSNIGGAHCC